MSYDKQRFNKWFTKNYDKVHKVFLETVSKADQDHTNFVDWAYTYYLAKVRS